MEWTLAIVAIRHVFPGVALGKSVTKEVIPMMEGLCGSELEVDNNNSSGWKGCDKVCNEGLLQGFRNEGHPVQRIAAISLALALLLSRGKHL